MTDDLKILRDEINELNSKKTHADIIQKLKEINKNFLKEYKIVINYNNKNLTMIPIETEIYYYNEKDNKIIFDDGMCHKNVLQKNNFGKLYFHRRDNDNKIKCASTKNRGRGGVDICISKGDYYLSILIRSAFINGTEKENLESGPRRICNRIRDFLYQQDKYKNISCFFEELERFEEIIQNREREKNINIENIFYQQRIVEKDYSKTDSKNQKLNCLNLGKNYQYLEWIKKQHFYTGERKKEIMILNDFSKGLNLLDDYDHQQLDKKGNSKRKAVRIKTEDFLKIVDKMKGEFASDVFAEPKDKSFESSVNQVYQTFDGKELYPTLEEKAAMLLYMIVKNHSFVDGNKRIAASCFLYFLDRNKMLYDKTNKPIIDSATLFALTLLIAESNPKDKDIIMQVVISVLNRN